MSGESIKNITKLHSNFTPTFVDHHVLPDINFNEHCLLKNDISIPKKSNKSIYFLHTRSTIKIFNHRFYIR